MSTCLYPPAASSDQQQRSRVQQLLHGQGEQFAQILLLVVLYAAPALIAAHSACVSDPDIWWHLRTGEWILQQHSVPHTDPFSTFGAGKTWAAYSWLFEILVFKLVQHMGLAGIVAYTAGMILAITAAMHRLVRRLQSDFSTGVLLTFVACWSLGHLYTPRPWLFTIFFFILEIDILMQARRTGRCRELLWLPLIFALWSNVHIQFVDGLIVLALALGESLLSWWRTDIATRIRPTWIGAVFLASVLATLANPYGWHIYQVAHDLAAQPGVLNKITELQSIRFRDLSDYCVLFLCLAAAAALARSKCLLHLEGLLLAFATLVSFRSQRDVWVVVAVAAAILATRVNSTQNTRQEGRSVGALFAIVPACVVIVIGFRTMGIGNQKLRAKIEADLPVRAVEFVKTHNYPGPVFNEYDWGGYLIWSLRLPVSIDGRAALQGDEHINRSISTWNGRPGWASNPDLQNAGVIIVAREIPLSQLLRLDPDFELTFEDKLATVFVRNSTPHQGKRPITP